MRELDRLRVVPLPTPPLLPLVSPESMFVMSWSLRRGVDRDRDCRLSCVDSMLTSALEVTKGLNSGAELPLSVLGTDRPPLELKAVLTSLGLPAECSVEEPVLAIEFLSEPKPCPLLRGE